MYIYIYRITAKDALNHDYFKNDPLPTKVENLPSSKSKEMKLKK